jgi:hypothetical protein
MPDLLIGTESVSSNLNAAAGAIEQLYSQLALLARQIPDFGGLNALTAAVEQLYVQLNGLARGLARVKDDATGINLIFPGAVTIDGQVLLGLPESAPADASIPNGHVALWNNAGTLTFRIRSAAGALSTKTL